MREYKVRLTSVLQFTHRHLLPYLKSNPQTIDLNAVRILPGANKFMPSLQTTNNTN